MGGMDGQWLGANARDRVDKLVLANTNFYYADKAPWADRIKFIREKGLDALVGTNMERWFTKGFRERAPRTIERMTKLAWRFSVVPGQLAMPKIVSGPSGFAFGAEARLPPPPT